MLLYVLADLVEGNTSFAFVVDLHAHGLFSYSSSVALAGYSAVQAIVAPWRSQKDPSVTPLSLIELEDTFIAVQSIVDLRRHDAVIGRL
jgi:hypothetical protein